MTPSRSTTPPGNSAAANTTTRPSPSYIAWPTTWSSPGGLKHEQDFVEYSISATQPCPSSTSRSRYPSWPTRPSRAMYSSGFPSSSDAIDTPSFPTTSRQKPFKSYLTRPSAKLCGTTCARLQHKVEIGSPSHASAESSCSSTPAPNNTKDTSPPAWKPLTSAKARRILAQPSTMSEPATPYFHPNTAYESKLQNNFDDGSNITYFPTTIVFWRTSRRFSKSSGDSTRSNRDTNLASHIDSSSTSSPPFPTTTSSTTRTMPTPT